jgi:hypothetical protein
MARLLPYLPVLACPLLMLACMLVLRRMGGSTSQQRPTTDTATRIAALERELADLRAQHAAQATDADAVAGEPSPAAGQPRPGIVGPPVT